MTEDSDSWDIVSGVGATAVIVASFRAEEAGSATPLVRDEFAELLISTQELSELRQTISSGWADSDETAEDHRRLVSYHAVRTHFFDHFCTDSVAAGIRQLVILASGLDSRAYRLAWAADTCVFELDMPEVLAYKSETLGRSHVAPKATLREVGVDLRTDWPAAIRAHGFDATTPTAWMLEGLLPFLEPDDQHVLFDRIDALSASGSRVGAEDYSGVGLRQAIANQRDPDAARGADTSSHLELGDLWSDDTEANCAVWFGARGWRTTALDSRRESERLGRPVPSLLRHGDPVFSTFITAEKG